MAEAANKYTNVPLLPSAITAVAGGSLTLGVVFLLKTTLPYLYGLIYERGSIQFLTIYAFWFALGMLYFKFRMLQKERSAFELPYVKSFTAGRDVVGSKTILAQHLLLEENLDVQQKDLLLINRINKGIKQLKISNTPAEVASVLSTVAATDSAIIDSSYVLIKFMIWIIPILGFLGTVIGMSQAIGSFNFVLQGIKEVGFQGMQQGLGQVTAGLAVAFDTTFLALVLSAAINFGANVIQKREEDLLSDVEDFTTENIVNKLTKINPQPVVEMTPRPSQVQEKPDASVEVLSREFKNLAKQNQVNANAMQEQLGRLIEAVTKLNQSGEVTAANGELPAALREFSQSVKESIESFKALGELREVMKRNLEAIESLKTPIEEMTQVNKKLGELYGKIYRTGF
jgi:biopolymer transport protein ExbB/TolQ